MKNVPCHHRSSMVLKRVMIQFDQKSVVFSKKTSMVTNCMHSLKKINPVINGWSAIPAYAVNRGCQQRQ
jgi:hypothetical protein